MVVLQMRRCQGFLLICTKHIKAITSCYLKVIYLFFVYFRFSFLVITLIKEFTLQNVRFTILDILYIYKRIIVAKLRTKKDYYGNVYRNPLISQLIKLQVLYQLSATYISFSYLLEWQWTNYHLTLFFVLRARGP